MKTTETEIYEQAQGRVKRMNWYAKVWPCGMAITEERKGNRVVSHNVVNVYRFPTAEARDKAVYDYTPPNHCPQAYAESVKASDEDVRWCWARARDEERYTGRLDESLLPKTVEDDETIN
jgi:hypothetical protein